jgi:DNA-binding LacI/PurR family transcriptional regulator
LDNAKKRPTISTISKITGLSPATISRALTGNGYVSKETRNLIYEAQLQLNYFPKSKRNSSENEVNNKLIMLGLPDNENPFWFEFIKGVQEVCKSQRRFPLLSFCSKKDTSEFDLIESARNLKLEGIIIVTLNASKELCSELNKLDMTKVLCSFYARDRITSNISFDYISVDTKKGTYLATEHLINQRYSRIGYIGLTINTLTGTERFEGYKAAMKDHGLEINNDWIRLCDDFSCEKSGYDSICSFKSSNNMPDAVCTANDRIAVGAYMACRDLKISIPGDFGLVGMDDIDVTYKLSPSISSIDISPFDLGRNSARLLFNRIRQPDSLLQNITLDPKLIIKESTTRGYEAE